MRVRIRDGEALKRLRPADIMAYLRSSGWHIESEITVKDRTAVWMLGVNDVVVPLWPTAADFPLRVSEVLHTLEDIENRSPEEIFNDIASTFPDIVRVHAAPGEENDGTLPLNFGVEFIEEARNMVLARRVRHNRSAALLATYANES